MDAERARALLLEMDHVCETEQFGGLVFWVGDKAIGGRMFAWMELADPTSHVMSFPAGPEERAERLERDGVFPAPYLARAGWVSARRWNVLRDAEWHEAFAAAHAVITEKLPRKTREALALPAKELKALIKQKRAELATKAEAAAASIGDSRKKLSKNS